jgi:hypothetical protein
LKSLSLVIEDQSALDLVDNSRKQELIETHRELEQLLQEEYAKFNRVLQELTKERSALKAVIESKMRGNQL